MSLSILSISSGSRGNCVIIFSSLTPLIIDVGIPLYCVKEGLALIGCSTNPSVVITHAHTDHIGGLPVFTKNFAPDVYCYAGSYYNVDRKMNGGRLSGFSGDFYVGDLTVSPFRVSHDIPCVGYSVYKAGQKISIVTDIGIVTEGVLKAIEGSHTVFLEANHDENLLKNNPNYPPMLKRRILSDRGHLSNIAAAETAVKLVSTGTKQIILGHLSEENNRPDLAVSTVCGHLIKNGIIPGKDVLVDVVGYNKISKIFKAETEILKAVR